MVVKVKRVATILKEGKDDYSLQSGTAIKKLANAQSRKKSHPLPNLMK